MAKKEYEIGMIGLGVMGRNLVLNMADHGFSVAGYDKDLDKVNILQQDAGDRPIQGAKSMEEFIGLLKKPRAVMMLVPAGAPVDSVINDVLPHLEKGDLIIDGGNSHYIDTDRRAKAMDEKGFAYLGVGISGGESGARHGPSMMPGGHEKAYQRVHKIFEAAAAHVNGDPCVVYLGPGSAGHYVKMVHNGIEYGIMQLISETYDLMKRGFGFDEQKLHEIYAKWNQHELNGYLMEITAAIFEKKDEKTGKFLVDMILDEAKQKGTGMWTSQDAMDLQIPVLTIDAAVGMRNMSAEKGLRESAEKTLSGPQISSENDPETFVEHLRKALYMAMIITYSQGMAQLKKASDAYNYNLDLEAVARIWRGGCIIRAGLLEMIRHAYKSNPDLKHLLLDPDFSKVVNQNQADLRNVVQLAADLGIPAPGLMTALGYFDAIRSGWLPANLIQAQRDYFGAHTYERVDEKGIFHTEWE
jgi:6-phosphogluconate dehydrogenase